MQDYFKTAMSVAAGNRGCTYWLEKTPAHTLCLADLMRAYPDAKFIAVVRNRIETVRSNVYKFGNPDKVIDWFKSAFWGEVYLKIILVNRESLFLVRYSKLRAGFICEVEKLFSFIGLDAETRLVNHWKPDSSYQGEAPPVRFKHLAAIWIVRIAFYFIPGYLCEKAGAMWVKRRSVLPRWFFRVYGARGSHSD